LSAEPLKAAPSARSADASSATSPARSTATSTAPQQPRSASPARLDRHRRFNGRLEHLRGSALDFRNLTHYIARSLLETGGFRGLLRAQTPTTPSILKTPQTGVGSNLGRFKFLIGTPVSAHTLFDVIAGTLTLNGPYRACRPNLFSDNVMFST